MYRGHENWSLKMEHSYVIILPVIRSVRPYVARSKLLGYKVLYCTLWTVYMIIRVQDEQDMF